MAERSITVPVDVPDHYYERFLRNMLLLTKGTMNLFLFTGDHGIEHLHADMVGPTIPPEVASPDHLFAIAAAGHAGGFVAHPGLIARYGSDYPQVPYVVKLNGKTNSFGIETDDPISKQLVAIEAILQCMEERGLILAGVGYTIYLGSIYEAEMLVEAARALITAHTYGLVGILWIYPRGSAITDPYDIGLVAGAASVAVSLGADFVKLQLPSPHALQNPAAYYQRIVSAAGNTGVITAGGPRIEAPLLLESVALQMSYGIRGVAIGRNIYQHNLTDAVAIAAAIKKIVYDGE